MQLFVAAKSGDLDYITKYVELHGEDEFIKQSIAMAAGYGHLHIVKYFDQLGYDLTYPNKEAYCFGNAARYNRIEVVKYLLSKKIDPGSQNYYGFCYACRNNNIDIVKIFVEDCKLSVHVRDDLPIAVACENNAHETIEYLLNHGANPNAQDKMTIYFTIMSDNPDTLKLLIKYGGDINIDFLILAGKNKKYKIFEYMIRNLSYDLSYKNWLPVYYGFKTNNHDLIKYIIDRNPNIDMSKRSYVYDDKKINPKLFEYLTN